MIQPPESDSSEELEEPENQDEIAEAKPEDEQESYGDIVIYRGPTGLVITSEDKEALAEFEQMMQMFGSQLANGPAEPTVIYLKYVKAAAAEELLKEFSRANRLVAVVAYWGMLLQGCLASSWWTDRWTPGWWRPILGIIVDFRYGYLWWRCHDQF